MRWPQCYAAPLCWRMFHECFYQLSNYASLHLVIFIHSYFQLTIRSQLSTGADDRLKGSFFLRCTVVSNVESGILFARFSTVNCINMLCSFLLWHHNCSKKFQSRMKVNFRGVGLLLSLHSFAKITFIGNNTLWVDPATHALRAVERVNFLFYLFFFC